MSVGDDIHNSLTGAWRLMTGKADGFEMLDLSVDGFWNSFLAMAVALPPFLVNWTGRANQISPGPELFAERLNLMPRLVIMDFVIWIMPLAILALTAKYAGLAGRFIHYVVAANWATAIIAWMMMPPALIQLFFPGTADMMSVVTLVIAVWSLIFFWRVTNAALDRGPVVATTVFIALFIVELMTFFALRPVLGLVLAG